MNERSMYNPVNFLAFTRPVGKNATSRPAGNWTHDHAICIILITDCTMLLCCQYFNFITLWFFPEKIYIYIYIYSEEKHPVMKLDHTVLIFVESRIQFSAGRPLSCNNLYNCQIIPLGYQIKYVYYIKL